MVNQSLLPIVGLWVWTLLKIIFSALSIAALMYHYQYGKLSQNPEAWTKMVFSHGMAYLLGCGYFLVIAVAISVYHKNYSINKAIGTAAIYLLPFMIVNCAFLFDIFSPNQRFVGLLSLGWVFFYLLTWYIFMRVMMRVVPSKAGGSKSGLTGY